MFLLNKPLKVSKVHFSISKDAHIDYILNSYYLNDSDYKITRDDIVNEVIKGTQISPRYFVSASLGWDLVPFCIYDMLRIENRFFTKDDVYMIKRVNLDHMSVNEHKDATRFLFYVLLNSGRAKKIWWIYKLQKDIDAVDERYLCSKSSQLCLYNPSKLEGCNLQDIVMVKDRRYMILYKDSYSEQEFRKDFESREDLDLIVRSLNIWVKEIIDYDQQQVGIPT